jgi:hypothetical protein
MSSSSLHTVRVVHAWAQVRHASLSQALHAVLLVQTRHSNVQLTRRAAQFRLSALIVHPVSIDRSVGWHAQGAILGLQRLEAQLLATRASQGLRRQTMARYFALCVQAVHMPPMLHLSCAKSHQSAFGQAQDLPSQSRALLADMGRLPAASTTSALAHAMRATTARQAPP